MPDVVEIYICKPGQKLEEGQLVVSHDISDKDAAKMDAEKRCKFSPSIDRIAYYAITESGDFRSYFSYKNPNVEAKKPKTVSAGTPKKRKRKKKPAKKSWWAKFKKALGI